MSKKYWALIADDKIISVESSEVLEYGNSKKPLIADFPIVRDNDVDPSEFSKVEVVEVDLKEKK